MCSNSYTGGNEALSFDCVVAYRNADIERKWKLSGEGNESVSNQLEKVCI